jgi:hypothetical protein
MDGPLRTFVEILAGLVVGYAVYVTSLYTLSTDSLGTLGEIQQGIQKKTSILNGVVDAKDVKVRTWNTVNPKTSNYLDMRRSVNRRGGVEYTYSFWMYADNLAWIHKTSNENNVFNNEHHSLKPRVYAASQTTETDEEKNKYYVEHNPNLYPLLIKGDKRAFRYQVTPIGTDGLTPIGDTISRQGRYVMSPMIAIGNPKEKEMRVYFNTLDRIDQCIILKKMPDSMDSTMRHNLASLAEKSWTMYTFVFSDYVPIDDFQSGIVIKSFVNDSLYQVDRVAGSLRENDGDLHVLPDGAPGTDANYTSRLLLSTTDYYNYALSDADVVRRYNRGFNTSPNSDVIDDAAALQENALKYSMYNKLDKYNL